MTAPLEPPPNRRMPTGVVLTLLLLLAAALRAPYLQNPGYTLDELWTAEVTAGHGAPHLHTPVNILLDPARLAAMEVPASLPAMWARMETTHPPLYWVLLRIWMDLVGRGDISERSLSVLFSLVAIGLLFDATRLLNGRGVAIWTCLLMIVASPEIDFARKTRNYAFAFMTLLLAADAVVRIEQLGVNRRRLWGLMLAVLVSGLAHYFCAGTILSLFIYAMLRLRGSARWQSLGAFVIAGLIVAICWGPFFWQQRGLFSVEDPGVSFVHDLAPGHLRRVIQLFFIAPATLLIARIHLGAWGELAGMLFFIPLVMLRRQPGLLLWYLWMLCTIGTIALLDATRSSLHLGFVRYVSMAGPGVYALIAAVCAGFGTRWIRHAVPAIVLVATACFARDAYINPAADPRDIADLIRPKVSPADVIVFASGKDASWYRGTQYMMLSRYLTPFPCPVVFLDSPPSGPALLALLHARGEFVFTSTEPPSAFLPGFIDRDEVALPSWGRLTLMVPPKPPASLIH